MKYVVAAMLALLAAGCAVPESNKARFQVENKTPQPVIVRASMGPYARQVVLAPSESWEGWIYAPLLVQGRVLIEIVPVPVLPVR